MALPQQKLPSEPEGRPGFDQYFMSLAEAVAGRANCRGTSVGAVLVREDRVVSTGYNGTPEGRTNCLDGGCYRCSAPRGTFPSGRGLDVCICVHAEQNAILTAARFGISVEGTTLYTTSKPCFNCLKEAVQLKIEEIVYRDEYPLDGFPEESLREQYAHLVSGLSRGLRQIGTRGRDPS